MRIKVTEDEIRDGTYGGCIACGFIQEGCEPDAREYKCEKCGEYKVYGLEELLLMDEIELIVE